MRALVFQIRLNELVLRDWSEWEKADQENILDIAKTRDLEVIPEDKGYYFKGEPENLYWFLQTLSYRYDIELI